VTPTPEPTPTPVPPEPTPAAAGPPVLVWEGFVAAGDGDESKCKALQVDGNYQLTFGYCGQAPAGTTTLARPELAEMLTRVAPFQYETPEEKLTFRAQGTLIGPIWRRTVLNWTRWTYSEATGHVCAACRTVLSWFMGQVPDQSDLCTHLNVLDHGYAYAEIVPCRGGDTLTHAGGWVSAGAWEQFDGWLYGRAEERQEDNYFLGKGTQKMSETEAAQLEKWAQAVYAQLAKQ
jgi:hypothetical protein